MYRGMRGSPPQADEFLIFFLFGSHPCSGFLSDAQETTLSHAEKTLETDTNTLETLDELKVGANGKLRSDRNRVIVRASQNGSSNSGQGARNR